MFFFLAMTATTASALGAVWPRTGWVRGGVAGHDTTIQSIVPGYKFDALLRRRDTERYDDRLIIRGNLIEAFDQLMAFVDKHLNDPFYMEGTTSINLRSIIFRELVANIIAHREYTSAAPATMMIYTDRVEFENPNVPHYHGRIDPGHFTPFPKNPTICKLMIQLGRYEELGSGVGRVNLYLPHYAPGAGKPVFEDGDIPDKPTSRLQKYRLTGKGRARIEENARDDQAAGPSSRHTRSGGGRGWVSMSLFSPFHSSAFSHVRE